MTLRTLSNSGKTNSGKSAMTNKLEKHLRLAVLGLLLSSFFASSIPAPEALAGEKVLHEFIIEGTQQKGGKSFGENRLAQIPCMSWIDKQPVAVILAIHGFGLHKGTYDSFARELAEQGIAVYAIDIRGFGSWIGKGVNRIDFDSSMQDIGLTLNQIKKLHPGLPIIVLGESMGGAVAMKAASVFPDQIDGLISSVPAGDRFDSADSQIGVVKHAFLHGMDAPLDVGPSVVGAATKKAGLREAWLSDPLARTMVTPAELLEFSNFMNKTFVYAPKIKKMPVLFIQGSQDKLVRPAGTWKLFNRISSLNKQFVLSTTAEHLIFEGGQFSNEDLSFIANWIDGSIVDFIPNKIAEKKKEPEKKESEKKEKVASTTGTSKVDPIAKKPADDKKKPTTGNKSSLSYWIELKRGGKVYRCNNKMSFQSGDAIRFHVVPDVEGYAYIVLQQGSTGNSAVLFPQKGQNNFLRTGQDYPLPYDDWLAFDANPGLEKVRIMFSKTPVDLDKMQKTTQVAYVSADTTGAKDLIGTGLQL
ncbi:MAG: alpha/beta fold hydrolase, partial [Candidatus Obscuribacterales bacterium]|nr:alpha/beta fold hydrolase [Candidatus Obscuribacterales bacterium]